MIAHTSMPSASPRETAKILGEMLGGRVVQFAPVGKEAYQVYSGVAGDEAVFIEVINEKLRHVPGTGDEEPCIYGRVVSGGERDRYYLSHIAITTPRSSSEIKAIADRVGWRALECWRGNAFPQTEVWVENRYMIEFMSPDQCGLYFKAMPVDEYIKMFAMTAAADGVFEPDPELENALTEIRNEMLKDRPDLQLAI